MLQRTPSVAEPVAADAAPIDRALLEKWALSYLGRYASSAENLRRVLQRRVRKRAGDDAAARDARTLIEALVVRYRETGLLDDPGYAAARARRELARGRPLHHIAAGLAAKGIAAADTAAAVAALRAAASDPDLAAAGAFARRRRLGPFRVRPPERQRELAAFARAGFARRVAEAVLACADEAALAALLAEEG